MKEHPEHKGYFVTEDGEVYSCFHKAGSRTWRIDYSRLPKKLSQCNSHNGYKLVCLRDRKMYRVHRLVAETYLPNIDNLPQVNHKDSDKSNNTVDNLEWCSGQYNNEYTFAKKYKVKTPNGDVISIFNLRKFCRDNGLFSSGLLSTLNGKTTQHKGYILLGYE